MASNYGKYGAAGVSRRCKYFNAAYQLLILTMFFMFTAKIGVGDALS